MVVHPKHKVIRNKEDLIQHNRIGREQDFKHLVGKVSELEEETLELSCL